MLRLLNENEFNNSKNYNLKINHKNEGEGMTNPSLSEDELNIQIL